MLDPFDAHVSRGRIRLCGGTSTTTYTYSLNDNACTRPQHFQRRLHSAPNLQIYKWYVDTGHGTSTRCLLVCRLSFGVSVTTLIVIVLGTWLGTDWRAVSLQRAQYRQYVFPMQKQLETLYKFRQIHFTCFTYAAAGRFISDLYLPPANLARDPTYVIFYYFSRLCGLLRHIW